MVQVFRVQRNGHYEKKVYLNVSCGLVLVSENTGGLNNVVSTSLTPWDLLRVPTS